MTPSPSFLRDDDGILVPVSSISLKYIIIPCSKERQPQLPQPDKAMRNSYKLSGRRMALCVVLLAAQWGDRDCQVGAFIPRNNGVRIRSWAPTELAAAPEHEDWFKQKIGESDMDFIKRLTSKNPPPKKEEPTVKPTKGYQPIEDWEEEQTERRKNGTMTWEERVQFEGLRQGDQIRQNDILMRQINTGL